LNQIAQIKQSINIPVIANGDINTLASLQKAMNRTGLIARAGSGRP
jgi:tRNA-dihydrouridine synthase B